MTGILILIAMGILLVIALGPAHRRSLQNPRARLDRPRDRDDVRVADELLTLSQAQPPRQRTGRLLASAGRAVPFHRPMVAGRH